MNHTPELVEKAIVQAQLMGRSQTAIAAQFGVHVNTVANIVARNGDLIEALKDVKGETFSAGFKYVWAASLDQLRSDVESGALTSGNAKNYALAMAISIDKVALVQGWPTQVIAHLHEHRHDIKDIATKLSDVAKRLQGARIIPDEHSGD